MWDKERLIMESWERSKIIEQVARKKEKYQGSVIPQNIREENG